jgi:phosphoglycolate phosphatase-like HAD superfamily hydrolase
MILDMLKKLSGVDRSEFLKVGDTTADIQEGKNAGVATVAILSGSQTAEQLQAEHPDYFIRSLFELKAILS